MMELTTIVIEVAKASAEDRLQATACFEDLILTRELAAKKAG